MSVKLVIPAIAVQKIIPIHAMNQVIAFCTGHDVIAGAPEQHVVLMAAFDDQIAVLNVSRIVPGRVWLRLGVIARFGDFSALELGFFSSGGQVFNLGRGRVIDIVVDFQKCPLSGVIRLIRCDVVI